MVLQVQELTFTYPDAAQPSLRYISFDMKQGQILGIIGGTGSGKSSLVQVLLGLYPADKGSIDLYRDGRSLLIWRSGGLGLPMCLKRSNSLRELFVPT